MTRVINKFTDKEKEQICQLYSQGIKATEICRRIESLKDRKPQTLYPVLIKAGLYKKKPANDLRKFKIDDNFFDIIDTEHKAYWLGFLLADGYLINSGHSTESFGITLDVKDKYILEKFKKDLNSTYTVKEYNGKSIYNGVVSEYTVAKFSAKSKKIFNRLQELGFTLTKTYDATLPLEHVPKELWNHLIRGYFDGDGGFNKASGKFHTYDIGFTGTFEVISSIRKVLNKENLKLSQRHKDRDNNNYQLRICGDLQCYNIAKWLYKDSTIYLIRKYDRFLELKNKYTGTENE